MLKNFKQNILIIDNHDSFTYNLVQLIKLFCNNNFKIVKNTELDFNSINNFTHILISPGPGLPHETANIKEIIKLFYKSHSILGICLGHQAIAECFDADLQRLEKPLHGISSEIFIDNSEILFKGLPSKIIAARYHSWIVNKFTLPAIFKISATTNDGTIMGISHKYYNLKGLQFHPESIITKYGKLMISNWIQYI